MLLFDIIVITHLVIIIIIRGNFYLERFHQLGVKVLYNREKEKKKKGTHKYLHEGKNQLHNHTLINKHIHTKAY